MASKKFSAVNSSSIHRVVYECKDEASLAKVVDCLTAFAAHQLAVPYPKTLVYHFSRPDPAARPLLMEFTEVYKDDGVFWGHLMGGDTK